MNSTTDTDIDLEFIFALEYKEPPRCESVHHSEGKWGHSDTPPGLWNVYIRCGCMPDLLTIRCDGWVADLNERCKPGMKYLGLKGDFLCTTCERNGYVEVLGKAN